VPEVRIAAEPRTEFGKGGARRTRRAGKIPAVLYGHGTDPRHISVPTREFEHALRTDGANVLLDLQLADGSELALPKSIQRDPVRDVAIHVVGDVVSGGMLDQSLTTLAVSAEATNIPSGFEVSIEGLEIGDSVHASQVKLPDGVEISGDPEQLVLHIVAAPTAAQMEAEGAGEVEEGAAGEAAAEGEGPAETPAAGEAPAEGGSEEPAAE
jgi:large subunit ribosomal protein L25